jgi:hypothetical protein
MQEVWETYMKPVDGRPASIAFNAEVSESLPDDELGFVGHVNVRLRTPTAEGFVSEAETDELGFIEDRLEMEALRYRIGKYVGRILTGGVAHFIFYLKYDFEWPDVVSAAMGHFPEYTFELGSRMDAEWEVYRKLILPTEREWQMIHNHHTCDRLKAAGDNLRLPRAIEHRTYFKTAEQRDKFVAQIEAEGFNVQATMEPTEETPLFGLLFYRIDTPYYYEIDALTLSLIEAGELLGGMYDGWETSLVKM